MKKKVIFRGLLGFPLGVFLGYAITILISLVKADGYYSPCVPNLIDEIGSEIGAIVFQAVMSGILGASFGAASAIWENDKWSIAKQTGIYFAIVSITMLPIAYFTHWMEHSVAGFFLYFSVFIAIFIILWLVQYLIWKHKIETINKGIEKE